MRKNIDNFKYEVMNGYDYLFDEKGNSFLALREVAWNDGKTNLELRKWFNSADGSEVAGKGFSFLTEEGPHELVNVLLRNEFGRTDEVLEIIKEREDFNQSISITLGDEKSKELNIESDESSIEYYDPKECNL